MAGFQKFPVPRWVYYMPWAHNKKWRGHSLAAFGGAMIISIASARFFMMRQVFYLK